MRNPRGIRGVGVTVISLFTVIVIIINPSCVGEEESPIAGETYTLPAGMAVVYPFIEQVPLIYPDAGKYVTRIFIADPKGGFKRLLLKMHGKTGILTPSSDGRYLAFVKRQMDPESKDHSVVHIMLLEDGSMRNVSGLDPLAYRIFKPPDFSPDGKWLVFAAEDASARKQVRLFVYNLERNELTHPDAIDNTITLDDNPPQFSSNGKEVYCTIKYFESGPYEFIRQLIAYDIESDTYRILAEFDMDSRLGVPIEGPRGEYIYFNYTHADWTNHLEVHRVPIEGGEPETVFDQQYVLYIVGFAPEAEVALMSYHIQETRKHFFATGNYEDGEVNLITGDDEDIALFPGNGLQHLSPDGSLILTLYHDIDYDYEDIMVMDLNGENRYNVSDTATYNEGFAAWIEIPEGTKIPVGGYLLD